MIICIFTCLQRSKCSGCPCDSPIMLQQNEKSEPFRFTHTQPRLIGSLLASPSLCSEVGSDILKLNLQMNHEHLPEQNCPVSPSVPCGEEFQFAEMSPRPNWLLFGKEPAAHYTSHQSQNGTEKEGRSGLIAHKCGRGFALMSLGPQGLNEGQLQLQSRKG